MAKVEADKVKIVVEVTPTRIYTPVSTVTIREPIHYTPLRNIDSSAPSNQTNNEYFYKEDVRIALMESVARALRSDYRLPEKLIVGSFEYELIKAFREDKGYITISAYHRPSQARVINVKMQPTSFTSNRNDRVQNALIRIIDGCISTAATLPSSIEIDKTTYRTNCSYAPGRANPPKEGWLHLTMEFYFTPVASVHFVENKDDPAF